MRVTFSSEGDLVFWTDNLEYRIGGPGNPIYPFDPDNPPSVEFSKEFNFLPRWKCGTTGTIKYDFVAEVIDPDGEKFEPGDEPDSGYYLAPKDRTVECDYADQPAGGIGFYWILDKEGMWKVHLILSSC